MINIIKINKKIRLHDSHFTPEQIFACVGFAAHVKNVLDIDRHVPPVHLCSQ